MCLMLATCSVFTTCERGTHYYYHNHHLPPACLTWTHYSSHPSPRGNPSSPLRVHIPAFWEINLLNYQFYSDPFQTLGELEMESGIWLGFLNMLALRSWWCLRVGQCPFKVSKRKHPTEWLRKHKIQNIFQSRGLLTREQSSTFSCFSHVLFFLS